MAGLGENKEEEKTDEEKREEETFSQEELQQLEEQEKGFFARIFSKKDIQKGVEEGMRHTHSFNEHKPEHLRENFYIRLMEIGTIIFLLATFLTTILNSFFPIHMFFFNTITSMVDDILLTWAYNALAFLLVIMIYFNVFYFLVIKLPIKGSQETYRDFEESLPKQIFIILIPTLIVLVDAFFLTGAVSFQEQAAYSVGEYANETTTGLSDAWSEFTCLFSPQCVLNRQDREDDRQATSVDYEINLEDRITSRGYEQIKESELNIPYSAETGEGEIYLDELRCYKSTPMADNLLDTQDLENRRISHSSMNSIGGLSCDISDIEIDETREIKIVPVLYFTIPIEYYQEITIVDLERFANNIGEEITEDNIYDITDEVREEVQVNQPTNSARNALRISRYVDPSLPAILHEHEHIFSEFFFDFSFEEVNTRLGDIRNVNLKSLDYSQDYLDIDKPTLPYEIDSYDGTTALALNMEVVAQNLDTTEVDVPVLMNFNTSMVKDDSSLTFTLRKERDDEDNDENENEE